MGFQIDLHVFIHNDQPNGIVQKLDLLLKGQTDMSTQIDNLKAKVDGLKTVVDAQKAGIDSLVALTGSLKTTLDGLAAGGSLSAADQATVQAASDEIDTTVAEVTANTKEATDAVAADTPVTP